MDEYLKYLNSLSLSKNTMHKYLHDAEILIEFIGDREITSELLDEYKKFLLQKYSVTGTKSMCIAANKYLEFIGANCRIVHEDLSSKSKRVEGLRLTDSEYRQLLNAAKDFVDERMLYIIKTLCGAGLQIGELPYVTAKAVYEEQLTVPQGKASRTVYLPKSLCGELRDFCWKRHILSGPIFITRSGNPVDPANIRKSFGKICEMAGVDPQKAFPQNFKNLYRKTYEEMQREIIDRMGL